ncbi:MAG: delta-aminolevulinic acid dehydratase [Alphaproteobacteria bacterium]|jgi:porphobilinogen synthase|tara:strand:- start:2598 stop:3518 length:921 start_codon:yes stop_codon:yes gene_type:complete
MKPFFPISKISKISPNMLIQPFFIDQKIKDKKPIKGLGKNYSWSSKKINQALEKDLKKGVKNFLLFIVPNQKQILPEDFSFHYDVIRDIKKQFGKDIVLLIDTCLCSITPDGHCGVSQHKKIDLQKTHYSLGVAANTYLEAGADIIAPSDMMKNTTKYLKKTFQVNGFNSAPIMSYSTKFKSNLYGPFREAAKSSPLGFDRSSYQLPVNDRDKAIKSSIDNAAQGADYLMVKPGMTSIDLINDIKSNTLLPTGVYQVSGEYASLNYLHKEKLGDYTKLLHESLLVFKRAKADFIITYGARDIVSYL